MTTNPINFLRRCRLQTVSKLLTIFAAVATHHCFAALPANLQIWPLGDSITYGSFGSNGGYRGHLYTLLFPNAANFLFVGSSTQNGGISTLLANQQHNEGHESYACNNIYTNLDGFDNSLFLLYGGASRDPNGGHWIDGIASGPNTRPALFPDLILLLIGANERDNPSGAQGRLDSLVSKIITLRPNARLIVGRITPIADTTAHSNFVVSYNQGVDAVVTKYAPGHFVTKVDLNTGFPANGLSSDNLHPNDTGYNWMAGKWYDAIAAVYAASGATFYQNTSYGGSSSQPLTLGTYTTAQLAAKGVPDNWASSARVPAGWTVTLYANDNLSGTSWLLNSDTPNFPGLSPSANDQVSSVKVESSSGVTFYANTQYGGTASQELWVGTYTLSQLAAKGMPNDWASSCRIPSGRTVIMYSSDNFSGQSWTLTADKPDFTSLSSNANDTVSSVKIQ
jgi:hypothetical protein